MPYRPYLQSYRGKGLQNVGVAMTHLGVRFRGVVSIGSSCIHLYAFTARTDFGGGEG